MTLPKISERTALAKRLHQERVVRRITVSTAARECGITEQQWLEIEYRTAGNVKQIQRLIQRVRSMTPQSSV